MNQTPPFELEHVPPELHAVFDTRVPAATAGDAEQRERNFLTRALASYAILKLSGCSEDEAANAIVDGGGDGGIDAVSYSPSSHRLFLVQSKFNADGAGEPSLGDVTKFKTGVENLLQANWLVLCLALRGNVKRFSNLTVKKIPKQVLSRCEWGHDDYSLQIENLPKAPPKAGQMSLFEEEEDA